MIVIDEKAGHDFKLHIIVTDDEDEDIRLPMVYPFSLTGKSSIYGHLIKDIEQTIKSINHVLSSLVKGLSLIVKHQKDSLDEQNNKHSIEFFSVREGLNKFPFKNESLGIKKIVSFIALFVEAYNKPGITLAIDEMDSGVFEHLLGEMLSIMKGSGRGQLIFTSHNLRPLERIDQKSVWFTTTDPNNRYVQIKDEESDKNLRSRYLRAIILGHKGFELYDGESKQTLAYALRKMGRNR